VCCVLCGSRDRIEVGESTMIFADDGAKEEKEGCERDIYIYVFGVDCEHLKLGVVIMVHREEPCIMIRFGVWLRYLPDSIWWRTKVHLVVK
jgi:hypothetical protein